jgi:hypothetical protein
MPTRNPAAVEDNNYLGESTEPVIASQAPPKRRGRSIYIPLDESGNLDASRIKDPTKIEAARAALVASAPPPPEPVETPKLPRKIVPHLYDVLSTLIGVGVKLAKWPRVMNTEQRNYFVSQLKYSEAFKQEATEPTANILDKYVGKSRVALWLVENQDVAILIKLLATETQNMFMRAAVAFNVEQARLAEEQEKKVKPNGGYPGSEFRGPENTQQ